MHFRRHGRSLVVETPAKLNLFLEILEKRPDGFHGLETLMVMVALYDTLTFTEEMSSVIRLRCVDASASPRLHEPIPDGAENLVVRAAELLRKEAGVSRGVNIELRKRIPSAAGLAGGSSDAAATLAALNHWWGLGFSRSRLQHLAAQLGSDIGFFLGESAAAICRGRGELIEPLEIPQGLYFVIARPRTGLATASVYRQCRPADQPRRVEPLVEALRNGRLADAARHLHNGLQEPAERLNSDVMATKREFSRLPVLNHQMSGSGTSYFGWCVGRRQAQQVAARLKATYGGWVTMTRSGS